MSKKIHIKLNLDFQNKLEFEKHFTILKNDLFFFITKNEHLHVRVSFDLGMRKDVSGLRHMVLVARGLKLNFICSLFYNFSFYYSSQLNFTTNLLFCRSIFGANNMTHISHIKLYVFFFFFSNIYFWSRQCERYRTHLTSICHM